MITKFNFSSLFSEAWYHSIIPVNIMAGFRKVGVYPFNRQPVAITEQFNSSHYSTELSLPTSCDSDRASAANACEQPGALPNVSLGTVPSDIDTPVTGIGESASSTIAGPSFTEEQQSRFQTRYKEGFDVVGHFDYACWFGSLSCLILHFKS